MDRYARNTTFVRGGPSANATYPAPFRPVEVRADHVEPRSRFEKVHAKGAVVDGERGLLGSLNWNPHSLRENREVALVVADPAVGRYYARLFWADWRGGVWRLPLGFGAVALLAVGVAVLVGRKEIRFG
ncbi:phospholipase D-like domain-containing protein [Halospeciosus flavus]|uniref:Phospholipase D-like domain-containing protein n=1 Tax=Halospeciosus flavus TaxID=3032283 RepID=A0ABD5Z3X0_9EURY|nr:phospholipase D-like domain-containing protein [Halospeciosus flavus]